MPHLLKYVRETGAIVGVWESTDRDLVAAQRITDDPIYEYLLHLELLPLRPIEDHYQVRDGTLMGKEAS